MNISLRWSILFLALVFCASFAACASHTGLEPAPGAMTIGKHEAVDQHSGVELAANADAWKGIPEVVQQIIPMKVTIRNNSGRPIQVRVANFLLVTDDGRESAALPPDQIRGEIQVATPIPYTGPSFYYHSFNMPPYFGYYPAVPGVVEPFYYDPFYYSEYYGYVQNVALPTKDMISDALPQIDLQNGQEITGFVYFKKIEKAKHEEANLRMDLVDANGAKFGTVALPFVVKK